MTAFSFSINTEISADKKWLHGAATFRGFVWQHFNLASSNEQPLPFELVWRATMMRSLPEGVEELEDGREG